MINKNNIGQFIWLGYHKKSKRRGGQKLVGSMYNVYTKAKTMLEPYQNDKGQHCAGISTKLTNISQMGPPGFLKLLIFITQLKHIRRLIISILTLTTTAISGRF